MTVVLLNLIILLAILYFLFYGLKKWKNIIVNQDDEEENDLEVPIEESRSRFPIWILLIGIFLVTFIEYIFR